MSETGPLAKLLAIGGTVAEGVTNSQHLLAIGVAIFGAGGAVCAFLENHTYLAIGAGALMQAAIAAGAMNYAVRRVLRNREARRLELLAEIQACYYEFDTWVSMQARPLSEEAFRQLQLRHTIFLTTLCEVAAHLFQEQRPRKGPFSANIKRVFRARNEVGELEPYYTQLTRYVGADADARLVFEKDQFAKPTKLADNHVYSRMFDERISEDFFMDKDIGPLVRKLRDERYLHPNDKTLLFYRSLAVFPIYGTLTHANERETTNWFEYNNLQVAGTLCVDSPKMGAFNNAKHPTRAQDLCTLKLLSGLAFSSFRLVSSASATGVLTATGLDRANGNG
jgi:hypothetical protein